MKEGVVDYIIDTMLAFFIWLAIVAAMFIIPVGLFMVFAETTRLLFH